MNAKAKKPAEKTDDLGLPVTGTPEASSTAAAAAAPAASEAPAAAATEAPAADRLEIPAIFKPTLRVKRLHEDARMPQYQTAGAACFDLHTTSGDVIPAGGARTFGTGLAFEVPEGFVMLIFSRSGMGKDNVRLANCVGVIDSDYRGEISASVTNDSTRKDYTVDHGARVAQAMLVQVEQWEIQEVEELSATARGANGYGSTGA